ncbi:MAG: hypothetical protein C0391_05960, partial [Anaerolinea sp.]|nr:hypothetical protein [Anaerolinea sp.]
LFAVIRTHYGIPRREDLRLAEYNTLTKVIGFVVENLQPAETEVSESTPTQAVALRSDDISGTKQDTASTIRRRVPKPVLRPRLDLCLPTGVAIDENSHILVVKDNGKVADALTRKLKGLGAQVSIVAAEKAATMAAEWSEKGNIQGIYFLPGLDADPAWKNMDLPHWQSALQYRLETLFNLVKALPEKAFVVSATRLGGLMGLTNTANPLGGVVSGFTKALAREHHDAFIKTVDFEVKASPVTIASRLLNETLHDASVNEIGWETDLRYTASLFEESSPESREQQIQQDSVVLVSGGTAGVVAPVVKDLVQNGKGKFYLLGRAKLPQADDPALGMLAANRDELMKVIAGELKAAGKKATPVMVEQKISALEKAKNTLDLMRFVQEAGGEATYLECDIQSAESVRQMMAKVAQNTPKVDVFIHAAGVEKSRKIETKTLEELHQVLDVKADGFFNLFKSMEEANLLPSSVVFFSSVAGRFGNSGQVDYSAANDLLSKLAAWLPSQYSGMKTVSIDWGAWGEVGMASRGSIPMLMERAGIDMMNPVLAAAHVRAELAAGTSGEVVVSGSLGALENVVCDNHEMDVARADAVLRAGSPEHIMLTHVTGFDASGVLHLETVLDPNEHPFLQDHSINGTPVLPGVMGIEGFSVAARHIASTLASEKAGFQVDHLEDIRFMTPFKFYKNLPRHIQWKARGVRESGGLVVYATLESDVVRHHGQPEHMLHFSGKVHLTQKELKEEVSKQLPVWNDGEAVCADDIYKLYFHGPSFQVLESAQRSGSVILGRLAKNIPGRKGKEPIEISIPMLVELCFQTAGLWEAGTTGSMSLPQSIGTLTLFPQKVNGEPIFAEVTPCIEEGRISFDARVMDAKGRLYLELVNYQTSPLPYASEPGLIEPMKVLVRN